MVKGKLERVVGQGNIHIERGFEALGGFEVYVDIDHPAGGWKLHLYPAEAKELARWLLLAAGD